MDYATKMAFRAVISCLRRSERITDEEVAEIAAELENAAMQARDECRRPEHGMLTERASDVRLELGRSPPAEPQEGRPPIH